MARRRNRHPLVPGAGQALDAFKADVMRRAGYTSAAGQPEQVKYEVASSLGIPLQPRGNGALSTEQAGKIGGRIGGTMVREMIRMAQEQLSRQPRP
ncbi:Small, acid-soluble spore protein, alpha/beta type [Paenibacillus sp. UNCCL117]|uniref:alpha/beta-type small acid-soluble spore protein n=1 Tax=unclassified Paenibacillus TaxID=185978 RepID=UPI00088B1A6A|nr:MULTISPECIES: alpha/beta-type small acid-soluble spore protein [unclassified Paenibacillus]SDC17769.1 Small, acid-soluble spore protein, alpha/beta type [Paenibacillus sp. cl123]SFW18072.1 Small, acid-soluble spore protein, alpha/beta type [Paenibacillus sp. UNCCL117]